MMPSQLSALGASEVGGRVRKLRADAGMSQKDLAAKACIPLRTLARVEAGSSELSLGDAVALGGIFKVPLTYFGAAAGSVWEAAARDWVRAVCHRFGYDPESPGLVDTPWRVARAMEELLTVGPQDRGATSFPNEAGYDQMLVVRGIRYYSMCEHHLLPFFGDAAVAYLPADNLLGISKFARAVTRFAHRLQLQERMTEDIAAYVEETVKPIGCGVVVRGHHLCMGARGVKMPESETITSALRGVFLREQGAKSEFLRLTGIV